jgi:hypothetical protein
MRVYLDRARANPHITNQTPATAQNWPPPRTGTRQQYGTNHNSPYPQQITQAIADGIDAAAKQYETRHSPLPPDASTWWFNFFLVVFTGGLVAVGVAQCFLIFGTLKATATAANAALRQANAMVALESPIPVIAEIKLVPYADRHVIDPLLDRLPPGDIADFCRVLVRFMNIGRSPLKLADFSIEWLVAPSLPTNPVYNNVQRWALWLTEKSDQWLRSDPYSEIALNTEQMAHISSETAFLWIYGRVRYVNFIREGTAVGFVARWNISSGFEADENPAYVYERTYSAIT